MLTVHMPDRPTEIEVTHSPTLGVPAVANLSEVYQMFPAIEGKGVIIESVGGVPMEPSIWEDLQHQLNYVLVQVTRSHALRIICSSEVVSYVFSPKSLYLLPNEITETGSSMLSSENGVKTFMLLFPKNRMLTRLRFFPQLVQWSNGSQTFSQVQCSVQHTRNCGVRINCCVV
jgi:hypothetical protein